MIESQVGLKLWADHGFHCIRDKSILKVIGIHAGLVKEKNHIDKHTVMIVSDFLETQQWNCDMDR